VSLAALLGIGLNAQQIAQHFSVTPAVVSRLLDSTVTAGKRHRSSDELRPGSSG
jgi:hypothetical protein